MSVNNLDYTKQLAKDREIFQESNRRVKQSAEKRVEEANQRLEHITNKQKDTFIRDKNEIQKNLEKITDEMKKNNEQDFKSKNDNLNKELTKEREKFALESARKSREFDQRLKDIGSTYQKSFETEKQRHNDLAYNMRKKHNMNIQDLVVDQQNQFDNYTDQMNKAGADLKERYNSERQQLVRAQEDRVFGLLSDASEKRAELKDRIGSEYQRMSRAHANDMDQQKQYTEDRIKTLQTNFDDRYHAMDLDYSERTKNLANLDRLKNIDISRQHQNELSEERAKYADDIRKIQNERRRRDNGRGQFAEVVKKQQGLTDEMRQENRIRRLKRDYLELQKGFNIRSERDQKEFIDALKQQTVESSSLVERKTNELNADKLTTIAKEREKNEREVANREHQNNVNKTAAENQLTIERAGSNSKLAKLRDEFSRTMKIIEDKNKVNVESVAKASRKDKNDFMKRVQETRADEVQNMKREFGKVMDATVQDYEQRLTSLMREYDYLKLTMDQKIQDLVDRSEKQLESQRELYEGRRETELNSYQEMADYRESQFKRNIREMNAVFQKKMDKMVMENETKLKLLTNDYENKIKELKSLQLKDTASKQTDHDMKLNKVRNNLEEQIKKITMDYEQQLDFLKKNHEEQMRNISHYKSLT